jgi:hypothetical protein
MDMASVRTGLVAALLLTTLTSCGLPVPGTASGTTAASTAGPLTENASQPPMEGSPANDNSGNGNNNGNGNDGGGRAEDPYVVVPTLPPGGRENSPDDVPLGTHCIETTYLDKGNAPIPPGVRLVITSVELEQGGDYFMKGGTGCGRPPCVGFAWSSGKEKCDVVLSEKPGRPDSDGSPPVSLLMVGKADCRAVSRAICADYVEKVSRVGTTLDTNVTLTLSETSAPATTTTTDATTEKTTKKTTEDAPATTTTA